MSTALRTPPSLSELGRDLLVTDRRRRLIAFARPAVGLALFVFAAWRGMWWLTPFAMFVVFVSAMNLTHDVVHRTLGLSRRATEWALFLGGFTLLESGHAYRATHLQHHRRFPDADDPEGYPARIGPVGALFYGPIFLTRLWWWAFRRAAGDRGQRAWLVVEAGAPLLALVAGVAVLPSTPFLLVYVVMTIVGGWVYPLFGVYLPHHDYGDEPLTQARTLRGRVVPAVFLELTYHLEHHLYPQVPSHHLAELGRRLDPFFADAGVRPRRVP